MNLDENITQGDVQQLQQQFDSNVSIVLDEIHAHLQDQDEKINEILTILKE